MRVRKWNKFVFNNWRIRINFYDDYIRCKCTMYIEREVFTIARVFAVLMTKGETRPCYKAHYAAAAAAAAHILHEDVFLVYYTNTRLLPLHFFSFVARCSTDSV